MSIFRKKGSPSDTATPLYKNSPVLRLKFAKLPKNKAKKPFSNLQYGFDELIDALTMIDPSQRPNCDQSLEWL